MVLLLRRANLASALRFRFKLTSNFHISHSNWEKRKVIKPFLLADIGEGITECEILKWSVKPPSQIQPFDTLCEVQSDKASVEITSPFEGVLKRLLVQEGEVAKVGQGLCEIEVEEEDEGESMDPITSVVAEEAAAQVASAPHPETAPAPPTPKKERRPHPLDPSYTPPAASPPSTPRQKTSVLGADTEAEVLASPAVRSFARDIGIPRLSQLFPGSGKDGRILKTDVESFMSAGTRERAQQELEPKGKAEDVVLELSRTRRAMWKAMTKSLEVPHFGYSTSLDVTELSKIVPLLNLSIPPRFNSLHMPSRGAVSPTAIFRGTSAEAQQVDTKGVEEFGKYSRITMLPLLLKSLSRAMMEWPLFRSSITPNTSLTDKPTLTLRPTADVSIALATPTGLYTPTISSLESLTPYEIASRIKRFQVLGERVPCGLTPADMPKKGAAISISNVGAIGKGEDAVPRLVEGGGVAIVAIGRARWEVRVMEQDGNISSLRTDAEGNVTEGLNVENRLMLPVSWSADHRIVEGAEMAAFVESWRGWVEQPMRLIGEGR